METSSVLLKSVRYCTKEIEPSDNGEAGITARQELVPGFNQEVMQSSTILLIGAGGIGGEIAQGLVRKGVGILKIFDGDSVELSNLSRQRFYPDDLYKNKAASLAKNLVREGTRKTNIIAYPFMFQRAIEEKIDTSCDLVLCVPDNDETRVFVSRYFYQKAPVVFTGLDINANTFYVFIQAPGKACFRCAKPDATRSKRELCPNTPAIIDILKAVAGFALFAIDSTLMTRKRNWNYRQVFLCGFVPDVLKQVEKRQHCEICSGS